MSCGDVRSSLHLDTESLSEAERLVLEDHLISCESCRTDRAHMRRVRKVGESLPSASIGPRGHARALASARMQGRRTRAPAARPAVPWWAFAGLAAAGAAALVVYLVARSDGAVSSAPAMDLASTPSEIVSPVIEHERRNVEPPSVPGAPQLALVEGTLTQDGAPVPLNNELPTGVVLRAATPATIVAVSVTIVASAKSELRRTSVEREVFLLHGSTDVSGDAARIATDSFAVEVHGDATVTPRRVTARKGFVRIFASDGRVLAAKVSAPMTWQFPDATLAANAAALLEQARGAFNARDYATAERHADAALDASPTRPQTAEARTLLAECAQATGKLDVALTRYEAIASRFADLPAGETALFAAARLQSGRDAAAGRKLFERYLEHYPAGRFAEDARRQLGAR
jgi:hypothetical protein